MTVIEACNNFAFYCNKSQFCENATNFYARNADCAIIGIQLLHDPFKLELQVCAARKARKQVPRKWRV